MSVFSIIKENRILVAGIIMPFLLVLLLLYAKTLPDKMIEDPQYKPVFTTKTYSNCGKIEFKVDKNGKLQARYLSYDKENRGGDLPKANIMIYDFKAEKVSETTVKIDIEDAKKPDMNIAVPEFDHIILSDKTTAPDGYIFEPYYYRNDNLITDIFISSGRNRGPSMVKSNRVISVPPYNLTYYGSGVEFIGWIIEEKSKAGE